MKTGDLIKWYGKLGFVVEPAEHFPEFIIVLMLDGSRKQIDRDCLEIVNESR